MPVSDMRALRAIHTHKLLNPTTHKALSKPSLTPLQSLQNPNFSRHFHSTCRLQRPEEPGAVTDSLKPDTNSSSSGEIRRVWSVFGPASHTLVTPRVANKSSDVQEPRRESESESESESETQKGLSSLRNGVEESGRDKTPRNVKKANSGTGNYREMARSNKKGGKVKTSWVCSSCGETYGQWWGACRSCHAMGTVKRFSESVEDADGGKVSGFQVSEKVVRSWMGKEAGEGGPMRLADVNKGFTVIDRRIPLPGLFGSEVERVLGGGLVRGSLVLVGGDPGVGKSTLVLQMASLIAEGHELGKAAPVVYVSGEESVQQIGSRADRMKIETEDLFLYSSTDIEDILEKIHSLNPQALIIDSIQTVYLQGVAGSAGGIMQVKECTQALLRFAKKTNVPVLLIGHVTKSGDIAGPRVLEHIVDVVLYMEGEKSSAHRLLRSVKNRFGSTDELDKADPNYLAKLERKKQLGDLGRMVKHIGSWNCALFYFCKNSSFELGVFEMSQSGLQAVSNPSEMFLSEQYSDSEYLAGLAVAVIMDGSRTFLIEIQALCVSESTIVRQVNGVPPSRASMIISVLAKQAGLKLQENAIFLNVVSGVFLKDTAGDLAIAAAICSSFLEFPIPNSFAFIGEIGLGGELRQVPQMDKRIHTVAKLGYKRCIVPKSAKTSQGTPGFEDIKIIGCKDLKEVISNVFK